MIVRCAANLVVAVAAAAMLSSCYVYAVVPPASEEPGIDHRLSGSWSVLDKQGKPSGVLLHFVVPGDGGPMRMIATDSANYGVFELYSVWADHSQVFAIRKLSGAVAGNATIMAADNTKFLLGTYRIEKDNTLFVYAYDSRKFHDAIAKGAIRGKVGPGYTPPVTLTGSAQDMLRSLATPDAKGAISAEPYPVARRLFPSRY
ncbi:MAG: hypothetical protein ACKVRO_05690 [Micropepsaceae bacterium]